MTTPKYGLSSRQSQADDEILNEDLTENKAPDTHSFFSKMQSYEEEYEDDDSDDFEIADYEGMNTLALENTKRKLRKDPL